MSPSPSPTRQPAIPQWAFNSATIMNCPWEQEVGLWEKFGWSQVEIWASKINARLEQGATTDALVRDMQNVGATPIGLCAGILTAEPGEGPWAGQRDGVRRLLELCNAMQTPALTVVVVGNAGPDRVADYALLAERLHELAELGAAHQVRLNLEFLGGLPLCGTLGTGIELVNRVNHNHLGLLLDFCHYYVSASHLEELEDLPSDKLFMVHLDDARRLPMEGLSNEARCFPGEGRIKVVKMVRALLDYGYSGPFTVELYDPEIWKLDPLEVMTRLQASLKTLEGQLTSA